MRLSSFRQPSILPGFGLTLGFSTFFLSALVLLPLAALVIKAGTMGWDEFKFNLTADDLAASRAGKELPHALMF